MEVVHDLLADVEATAAIGLKERAKGQGELCLEEARIALRKTLDAVGEAMNNQQKDISRCLAPHVQDQLTDGYNRAMEERGRGLLSFELGPKSNRITRERRMNWPSAGRLFSTQYRRRTVRPIIFRMRANNCADTAVNADSINPSSSNPIPTTNRPSGGTRSIADTEHAIDVSKSA